MKRITEKLSFYILRLRRASAAELRHRTEEKAFISLLKKFPTIYEKSLRTPEVNPGILEDLYLPVLNGHVGEDIVDSIINGWTNRLALDQELIDDFEKRQKGRFFTLVRQGPGDPDIRSIWEPARLQHLTILVQYAQQNPAIEQIDIILKYIKENIFEWIDGNPPFSGPHYMSVMECGLRIPVFLSIVKSAGGLTSDEKRKILGAVYEHAWLTNHRPSLYSSLGNHTIAESVGLVMAGAVFKDVPLGKKWLETGISLLEKEGRRQILEDGGPLEQSLDYHRFVIDLVWIAVDFLDKNNLHDCGLLRERLIAGENFLAAFQNQGLWPNIGDSDSAHAAAPGLRPGIAMEIYNDNNSDISIKTFSESGYTVLRNRDMLLTFDHGPLGMAPLFNHGHADALSITLSILGKPFLVDPGTFRYNGVPEWRKYFKGTRAHNTVNIDAKDQAVQESGFIWSHDFQSRLLSCKDDNGQVIIRADNDGYMRLQESVKHERTVFYSIESGVLIKDVFTGQGSHEFELNYHLHPDLKITEANGTWELSNDGIKLFITSMTDDSFVLLKGSTEPIMGWFSPSYGVKMETGVLTLKKRGAPDQVEFITAIRADAPADRNIIFERLKTL